MGGKDEKSINSSRHAKWLFPSGTRLYGITSFEKGLEYTRFCWEPSKPSSSFKAGDSYLSDSFRNKELRKFVKENGYEEIHVCGLDQFGCVGYTAIGATKQGLKSFIVKKGTATILPEKKILKMHNKLDKAGVLFI